MSLAREKVEMNAYATLLFMSGKFITSEDQKRAMVVETSVKDLGFHSGAIFQEIVEASNKFGLQLCPLELAPHFRLSYLKQEEGPYLTIASPTADDDENSPNGFYLQRYNHAIWLRGYDSSADWLWHDKNRLAFIEEYS